MEASMDHKLEGNILACLPCMELREGQTSLVADQASCMTIAYTVPYILRTEVPTAVSALLAREHSYTCRHKDSSVLDQRIYKAMS
jgi:hypothetical protein